jgi:hypothetical protein
MSKIGTKYVLNDEVLTTNNLNYKECYIMSDDDSVLETVKVFENNGQYDANETLNNMGVEFGVSTWITFDIDVNNKG